MAGCKVKSVKTLVAGGILLVALAGTAAADIVYVAEADWTGSRSTPTEVVAADGWTKDHGGFKISWEISLSEGVYTYTYWFSNAAGSETIPLDPEVSNFVLEVSLGVTDLIIAYQDFTYEGPQWWYKDPNYPNSTQNAGANEGRPNQPENIYGIKLEPDQPNLFYTFQSPQAPVWGDFYAKDGTPRSGLVATAWNFGIGTDPTVATTDFGGWIPTPDTIQGAPLLPPVIPAPPAVLLGLLGLGLADVTRRLRR